ncbi:hypothetical protein ABPG72_009641 [Tetrahymena utriculariae]
MDIFFQGIGLCSFLLVGSLAKKKFYPYLVKKNIQLLKSRYNPNGNSYALITGSSDGIGKEFAKLLAQENMNIILHGRNIQKLNNVKEQIIKDPKTSKDIKVEIFEQNLNEVGLNIEQQAQNILNQYKIQLLINNAGITSVESLKNCNVDEMQQLINTNITSPIVFSKYVIQNHFTNEKEEYGIINISSLTADFPIGFISIYSASKSFLNAFSQSLQQETSANIQITSIKPYYISTKMTRFQKLSFDTISTQEFVNGAINSFLYKQNCSCGNWKHELIYLYYSLIPSSILQKKLTQKMEIVANQLYKIKQIGLKRQKVNSQKQNNLQEDKTE